MDTSNTQIHDRSLSWLVTGTLIKSGWVKLEKNFVSSCKGKRFISGMVCLSVLKITDMAWKYNFTWHKETALLDYNYAMMYFVAVK
jgi:hypothetical protein